MKRQHAIRVRNSLLFLAMVCGFARNASALEPGWPSTWIGYTEFRTNLPGGRHANIVTMRAKVVRPDSGVSRPVGETLANEKDAWTQFSGWSPDGRLAIVGRGWESPENARWEEEHRTFRFEPGGWLYDMFLVNLDRGAATNLTGVERVSFYNTGLFFWPGDANRLGFQALIGGNSHPFSMGRDGKNKRDLTENSTEFSYGFNASKDGRRIAYHKSYQVYIADADGSNARKVETGQPFNFAPQWSPDGTHLLFVSGEHYNCHPHIVQADGKGLRKAADRGGYKGVTDFLDVPDFHNGSSDIPAWSVDGKAFFYTSKVGENVELFRATLDGKSKRLTTSPPGSTHYHPTPSPDGRWLAFGARRDGVRQLCILRLDDNAERRITDLKAGHAALWPHWQPTPGASK